MILDSIHIFIARIKICHADIKVAPSTEGQKQQTFVRFVYTKTLRKFEKVKKKIRPGQAP